MADEPVGAPVERVVSEAEQEIRTLASELMAKIHAVAGDVEKLPNELDVAKLGIETAVAWVEAHFRKIETKVEGTN